MNAHSQFPAAVLWDMDGTLVDTEPYWIAAEIELCAAHGVTWTHDDGLALVGNPLTYSAQIFRECGVDLPAAQIIDSLLTSVTAATRADPPWMPDAVALLDRLRAAGVPLALVTMSYDMLASAVLDVKPVFDAVVTGEQVERGKPDPESYLTAADRLGVRIEDCLAIEDSPSGIASALAAGARTVGVQRVVPVAARDGLSRVSSLDSLTDDAIAAIMGGAVLDTLG